MINKLKALWKRLKVRWSVLSVALLVALPQVLDYLGLIDIRPILEAVGVPDSYVGLIVSLLPFVLIFVKNVIHLEP
jgi:hypothetical protein